MHYIPRDKGAAFPVVDDALELSDLRVSVRTGTAPCRVVAAPQGDLLPCSMSGPYAELCLPRGRGHQMVVLEMGSEPLP